MNDCHVPAAFYVKLHLSCAAIPKSASSTSSVNELVVYLDWGATHTKNLHCNINYNDNDLTLMNDL